MTLNWEDPPAEMRGGRASLAPLIAELKANPGKWALVRVDASAAAGEGFKKKGCKVTRRKVGDNKFNIYAMWPPTNDES